MTAGSWALAAALCWHLGASGGLPREVAVNQSLPWITGQIPLRVVVFAAAREVRVRPRSAAVIRDGISGAKLMSVSPGVTLRARVASGQVALRAGRHRVVTSAALVEVAGDGAVISAEGGWGRRGHYPGRLEISPELRGAGARVPLAGRARPSAPPKGTLRPPGPRPGRRHAPAPRGNRGGLQVVNVVDLESYVAGVVAAELPAAFPLEAMKAQAIAARTYALLHRGDHERQGADLCGDVHCQVYAGLPRVARSRAAVAVQQTAGQVLVWDGLLVDAMYHSACGGSTAAAWEVRQGKLLPYLVGVGDREWSQDFVGRGLTRPEGPPWRSAQADLAIRTPPPGSPTQPPERAYCEQDHRVGWSARFTRREAEQLIGANLGQVLGRPGLAPGSLRSIRIAGRQGDRVEWLEVAAGGGVWRVRGDSIRWLFGSGRPGPSGLRSTAFTLAVERDRRGLARAFVFTGTGRGHGLGMCQWGARGRAETGQTAAEILSAYYPGAVISSP